MLLIKESRRCVIGKCITCGFAGNRQDAKGTYKLFCDRDGAYKRNGDSCLGYWEKNEMKDFIDKAIKDINNMED